MELTIDSQTITLPPLTRQICVHALGGLTRFRMGLRLQAYQIQALEHLEEVLDSHCYDFSFLELIEGKA